MERENRNLLSAIIPFTSNPERVRNVIQIVESAANLHISIVLVYDSEDAVPEQIQFYVNAQPDKILLINGYWQNPGDSRNAGLAIVKTDWVTFWDSDDAPNCLLVLEMVENAEASSSDCCVGGFEISSSSNVPIRKFSPSAIEWQESAYSFPGLWRFAFRFSKVSDLKFSQISMGEDQEFLARALTSSDSIYVYDGYVYKYIIGASDQLTKKFKNFGGLFYVFQELDKLHKPSINQVAKLIGVMKFKLMATSLKRGSLKVKCLMFLKFLKVMLNIHTFRIGNVGHGLILSLRKIMRGV